MEAQGAIEIKCGTTPTLTFTLPQDVSTEGMTACAFDIVQINNRLAREGLTQFNLTMHGIEVTLTQQETLRFSEGPAKMELNWLYANGTRVATPKMDVVFLDTLHPEVMTSER